MYKHTMMHKIKTLEERCDRLEALVVNLALGIDSGCITNTTHVTELLNRPLIKFDKMGPFGGTES